MLNKKIILSKLMDIHLSFVVGILINIIRANEFPLIFGIQFWHSYEKPTLKRGF